MRAFSTRLKIFSFAEVLVDNSWDLLITAILGAEYSASECQNKVVPKGAKVFTPFLIWISIDQPYLVNLFTLAPF
jgi:hypothetical protein